MVEDDQVRDLCAGREEWHVRKGDGIVMYFDRRDSLNPEREARQWLAEHQRDYPERFAGYEVVPAVVQSPLQRTTMDLLAERNHLRGLLLRLVEQLGDEHGDEDNAPGHGHRVPGIWDPDNGDMAGQPCALCAVWMEARRLAGITPTSVNHAKAKP